jgi:hypothetical protein
MTKPSVSARERPRPRQHGPDEEAAFEQLGLRKKNAKEEPFSTQVTDPLRMTDKGAVWESREFFWVPSAANPG